MSRTLAVATFALLAPILTLGCKVTRPGPAASPDPSSNVIEGRTVTLAEVEALKPGMATCDDVRSLLGYPATCDKRVDREDWRYYYEPRDSETITLVQQRSTTRPFSARRMDVSFEKDGKMFRLERQ